MNDFTLISYNCQGLRDLKKRLDILDFLKGRNAHIYCLQDCHFTSDLEQDIYSQWEGECFFSFGKSNSRGVTILLKQNLPVKIHNKLCDDEGNMLRCFETQRIC